MILVAVLVVLFLLFFFIRHHFGPALLAMIAGLSIYELFGSNIVNWIHSIINQAPLDIIDSCVYAALILLFPLLLYLRSSKSKLFGLFRFVEALVFATLLTAFISTTISKYISFDSVAIQISNFIISIKGYLIVASIVAAYLDIILYRS